MCLTADDCKLVHEDMTKILTCVHGYFLKRNVSYYKKMQHTGYLRHLLLRRGVTTGEILVHVVTTSQEEYDLEPLKEELLALPLEGKIVGIMHIINDSLSDVVQSDETKYPLWTGLSFMKTLLGTAIQDQHLFLLPAKLTGSRGALFSSPSDTSEIPEIR